MRVVLDTNVLVAALLIQTGPPAKIYTRWTKGAFTLRKNMMPKGDVNRPTRSVDLVRFLRCVEWQLAEVPLQHGRAALDRRKAPQPRRFHAAFHVGVEERADRLRVRVGGRSSLAWATGIAAAPNLADEEVRQPSRQ